MVKMNGGNSMDSNTDESFVVLERCTEENGTQRGIDSESYLPSVVSQILHPNVSQQNCSTHSATPGLSLMSVDDVMNMNSEEIQKRLQDVIKENADLKVTLQQHNLAMKQQFQTLKMWQDEVYKVHQTHKEKFEETKQFINRITTENKELKMALTKKPKEDVQSNEANSKLLAENTVLQKQVNVLQEKLSAHREKKYIQPTVKETELNSIIEQLTRQLEVAERARRQLSIDVERLTAQNSRMQLPLSAPIVMLEESPSHENIQPAEQLKRYNELLLRVEKMEDEMRGTSLASWMPVESENLTFEVQELRKLLIQEQKLSASRKEAVGEVRQCFQRLLSDYQNLYHDWEWLKQEKLKKERDAAYEEVQQNGYREKIDNLTAQLVQCKEALNEKNSFIDSLKDQIEKLKVENESIEILKAQANVFQTDFEAERKSREDLVSVKEKLAEDLRHLQRRNQQLLGELLTYQDASQVNGQLSQLSRSASKSPSPTPGPVIQPSSQPAPVEEPSAPQTYTCPNPDCNKVFDLYPPLERHVVKCLKLED